MKLKSTLKALATALPPILERSFRAATLTLRAFGSALSGFVAAAPFLCALVLMAGLCPANAGEPCHWERKPNKPAPFHFDTYHGETIDFRCTFIGFSSLPFGQSSNPESSNPPIHQSSNPESSNPPIHQSSNAPNAPRLYYQTNGMASAWWDIPATVSTTVVTNCQPPITNYSLSATFPPSADPGAERLNVFFGAPSNAYAAAQVRFRNSPGATPNVLPPPVTIDWLTQLSSATNALAVSLSSQMSQMSQSATNYTDLATNTLLKSFAPTISNTVTKSYVESLGIESTSLAPATNYTDLATNTLHKSFAPTISNTVTKSYVESLGIESGVDAQTVTNMTALTPVYGGNGERFSDWVVVPNYDGLLSVKWLDNEAYGMGDGWFLWDTDAENYASFEAKGNSQSTSLSWTEQSADYTATATRTENPIVGYTLGTQTNSVLAATNSLISASTATNIAFAVSADATNSLHKSIAPTITNTVTKSYVESLGIESGISAATATNIASSVATSATNDLNKSLAPTITNIASTVSSSAIASADTTYRRTIGITNLNQSVQYVNITSPDPTTLAILMPTGGVTKDWMVYVSSVTNIAILLPPATWWMADTAYTNDIPPATPTALWFSQVTDGVFILGRQELTEVAP